MPMAGFFVGFADFEASHSLHEVAEILSRKAFGGIRFVEKDVDEEYDLGTLTMERDFLGIQVDLVGSNGSFTLELGTLPSASVEDCPDVCDLSRVIQKRLSQIAEVRVTGV